MLVERAQNRLYPLPVEGPALFGIAAVLGIDLSIGDARLLAQRFGELRLECQKAVIHLTAGVNFRSERNAGCLFKVAQLVAIKGEGHADFRNAAVQGRRTPGERGHPIRLQLRRVKALLSPAVNKQDPLGLLRLRLGGGLLSIDAGNGRSPPLEHLSARDHDSLAGATPTVWEKSASTWSIPFESKVVQREGCRCASKPSSPFGRFTRLARSRLQPCESIGQSGTGARASPSGFSVGRVPASMATSKKVTPYSLCKLRLTDCTFSISPASA